MIHSFSPEAAGGTCCRWSCCSWWQDPSWETGAWRGGREYRDGRPPPVEGRFSQFVETKEKAGMEQDLWRNTRIMG